MKTISKALAVLLVASFGFIACSEDDSPQPGGDLNTANINLEEGSDSGVHVVDQTEGDGNVGGSRSGDRGPIYE